MSSGDDDTRVRIDKWLWAARFFKTRSLAATAISGGKVDINGTKVKRSKLVQLGDVVCVRKGPYQYELTVRGLSERRGPASVAQKLYEESEASVAQRDEIAARLAEERAAAPPPIFKGGRPTKKDRRALSRFKRDSSKGR